MRKGIWHQMGYNSQNIVQEQLECGVGVGVIISPRDLNYKNALIRAKKYHESGADVLIDQQFYEPTFSNDNLSSYEISQYRDQVLQDSELPDHYLTVLSNELRIVNSRLETNAIIAPALVYEAGRPDIDRKNGRLFNVAKMVGDDLGVPTYATVILGSSVTSSENTISAALSQATSLNADGWYFGFEFAQERIPSCKAAIYRCCRAGLILASTGKPVLHAFAGPLSLLSFGFGATGTAIGHFQNLWKFSRSRWELSKKQGGDGKSPPRFFSISLWGTIVQPDEIALLPIDIRKKVLTHSPFSQQLVTNPLLGWEKWDSYKHLLYLIGSFANVFSTVDDPKDCSVIAIEKLDEAIYLHSEIKSLGIPLRDATSNYQLNWQEALIDLLDKCNDDFEYLHLISSV